MSSAIDAEGDPRTTTPPINPRSAKAVAAGNSCWTRTGNNNCPRRTSSKISATHSATDASAVVFVGVVVDGTVLVGVSLDNAFEDSAFEDSAFDDSIEAVTAGSTTVGDGCVDDCCADDDSRAESAPSTVPQATTRSPNIATTMARRRCTDQFTRRR